MQKDCHERITARKADNPPRKSNQKIVDAQAIRTPVSEDPAQLTENAEQRRDLPPSNSPALVLKEAPVGVTPNTTQFIQDKALVEAYNPCNKEWETAVINHINSSSPFVWIQWTADKTSHRIQRSKLRPVPESITQSGSQKAVDARRPERPSQISATGCGGETLTSEKTLGKATAESSKKCKVRRTDSGIGGVSSPVINLSDDEEPKNREKRTKKRKRSKSAERPPRDDHTDSSSKEARQKAHKKKSSSLEGEDQDIATSHSISRPLSSTGKKRKRDASATMQPPPPRPTADPMTPIPIADEEESPVKKRKRSKKKKHDKKRSEPSLAEQDAEDQAVARFVKVFAEMYRSVFSS